MRTRQIILDKDAFIAIERIRQGHVRPQSSFTTDQIEKTLQQHTEFAGNLLVGTVKRLVPKIYSERPDIAQDVKTLARNPRTRMRTWLEGPDRLGMHDVAVRSMPEGWVKDTQRLCLGDDSISWQYSRLASVLANEYYYLRQTGGIPGDRRTEHDYQNMEYVLLLSRADAILTRDNKLVKPLAQAAFPDKDVFFELGHVPKEYACCWK